MTIVELAVALNQQSKEYGFNIAELPLLRRKFLSKSRLPNLIFHTRTIFEKEKYAFHYGGRDEMQFNVGEDFVEGKKITRFCLALSLEPSRSLVNPLKDLKPFFDNLNNCLHNFPDDIKQFKLWYRTGIGIARKSIGFFNPLRIDKDWYQLNNLICLGSYIDKGLADLNKNDIENILKGLDDLLPIYSFCVLKQKNIFNNEKKFAGICWNENTWTSPSGSFGKSNYPDAHEFKYGYGHEEWLFDFSRIIGRYHFCLLQAVENGRQSFIGRAFDVRLYSHNSETDEFFWIGEIRDLEIISSTLANDIYKYYKEKKWLIEMAEEIKEEDGDRARFLSLLPEYHFNVKFRPENVILYNPYIPFLNFKQLVNTHHYQFIKDNKIENNLQHYEQNELVRNFKFAPNEISKSLRQRKSQRRSKIIEIEPVHDKIQTGLYNELVRAFTKENVSAENDTGISTRIDIVVKKGRKFILYEVKSYPSIMISIRTAFGQILEYGYWPNPIINIDELIIVSHIKPTIAVRTYMKYIRTTFGVNIYYQFFDLNLNALKDKV